MVNYSSCEQYMVVHNGGKICILNIYKSTANILKPNEV
jgi:hypothetical protein